MAEGCQSLEESEEVNVASMVQGKSNEELPLYIQEGSKTTEGDPGTDIEQLEDACENLTPGGHEHGTHSTSNPESVEDNRKLHFSKSDELVGHEAKSSQFAYQEIIAAQQKKLQCYEETTQQLALEFGRRLFLEDKQERSEKAYSQLSRTLASAKTGISLQQRLLEISNSLSDVELRQMKFLAKTRVNAFRLAKIREGFELFEELDACGELSCTYVRELLKGIQRFDLLEKLHVPLHGNAESADGAFYMDPVQEPRLQPPTGQKMLNRITESSVMPPRNHNLNLLPARRDHGSDETLDKIHIQNNGGVSGINEAGPVSNIMCRNSVNSGSDMVDFPMNAVCDELPMQSVHDVSDKEESVPASRYCKTTVHQLASDWTRSGARPKNRPAVKTNQLEPSLVEPVTCRLPDAFPLTSSKIKICEAFIARYPTDRSLLESQHHCSTGNELSTNASLPMGASCAKSMINCIESTRIKEYTVHGVASTSGEHNRLNLPSPMGEDERDYEVGGSTFDEPLHGNTGQGCTQNEDHLPIGRSNGALSGVLSEVESTAARPYAPGNASSTLLNTAGDHVVLEAVVSEPCSTELANSRVSLSDRNAVTDCYRINTALLNLAQCIQEFCVASGEQHIEGERQREERVRAWNSNRRLEGLASPPQGQANPIQAVDPCLPSPFCDCIGESLGSTNNSARVLVRREAAIRRLCTCEPLSGEDSLQDICRHCFRRQYFLHRGPSSHSGPWENSCVCLENDGSQACSVYGTIVPVRCRPNSAHNMCCKCLEDVFSDYMILPCSHCLHKMCLIDMIQNNELSCPICGRAFLRRG